MYTTVWSTFYLLLSCVSLSICFQIPSIISNDCYPDVEQKCDEEFLTHADITLPNSTLKYFLFTNKNPKEPELLHMCNGTLSKDTKFNPKKKLLVFIPGFMYGVCQLSIIREIKDEFLEKDYNVLLIDPILEYGFDYVEAFQKMPEIAKEAVKVLKNIQDKTGIKSNMIELAGHSLGAQLSGQISQHFKVHRISGIDPAGIYFTEKIPANLRLDPTDADLVDIYHCNGGTDLPDFGIGYPAGHADFYINGGALQNNCHDLAMRYMKGLDMILAVAIAAGPSVCSHLICLNYFQSSVNNKFGSFYAWECDSYKNFREGKCVGSEPVLMGYDYERNFMEKEHKKSFPRKYYLTTETKWPYIKKYNATSLSKGEKSKE